MKKTVLITGSTSGIGREIFLKFAREGWDIVCHYCTSEVKAVGLKREADKFAVKCHLIKSDFSSEREVKYFVRKIKKIEINSIINNAGTYLVSKHFGKLTFAELHSVFMVNVFSPMIITAAIFLRMKEKGFGRIVNISSIAAKYGGSSHSLHYGCSKLALEGLTKTLAREGAPHNVLVNTVRPGVIDSEFHKKFPKDMKKRLDMIPVKHIGTPQDVADIVYYLGSENNKFITNDVIAISGGE